MSKVYLKPLDDILTDNDEKRAFLYGVASYLKNLNTFASSKTTPNLTEYNVGGVISIVEQIETLAETYKTPDTAETTQDNYRLLLESWFCYQNSKDVIDPINVKNFFASDYDRSGKLPLRIGQFLITVEPAINIFRYEMFKVSFSLLARYSDYIKYGKPIQTTDNNDESYQKYKEEVLDQGFGDLQALLRSFKTIFKLEKLKKGDYITKASELRREGNVFLEQKHYGAAIKKYTDALNIDPSNYAILANRAAAFTLISDPESAIKDLKDAIEFNPEYETAWTRLGFSYLSIGDSLKSVEAYSKAIKLAAEKKMIDPYIRKLYESLMQAESRARANGLSDRLPQFLDPIRSILAEYQENGSAAQSAFQGQQVPRNTQHTSSIPNTNGIGQQGGGIQPNVQNIFEQMRNYNNGNNEGQGNFVTALNGIGTILASSNAARSVVNSNDAQGQTNSQPTDDPEVMIPEDVNDQNQAQPQTSHGIADLIRNSLPEGLRNTIGPAIRMAMNSTGNNQFGSPTANGNGVNGGVIFTTITTGPNGEITHNSTSTHPQGQNQNHNNNNHDNNNAPSEQSDESGQPSEDTEEHPMNHDDFDLD